VPYKGIANTGWTQVKITIGNKAPPHEAEREVKNISVVLVNGCPHLKGLVRSYQYPRMLLIPDAMLSGERRWQGRMVQRERNQASRIMVLVRRSIEA
jgi:hypothetical protein